MYIYTVLGTEPDWRELLSFLLAFARDLRFPNWRPRVKPFKINKTSKLKFYPEYQNSLARKSPFLDSNHSSHHLLKM